MLAINKQEVKTKDKLNVEQAGYLCYCDDDNAGIPEIPLRDSSPRYGQVTSFPKTW